MRYTIPFCLALAVVVPLAGCGPSGPETYEVSGTVTFDGKPVPDGEIVFRDAEGTAGSWAGKIEDGQFRFRSTAGKKRVEIIAYREYEDPALAEGAEGPTTGEMYIPDKYNTKSELSPEVPPEGPNEFDFPLEPES